MRDPFKIHSGRILRWMVCRIKIHVRLIGTVQDFAIFNGKLPTIILHAQQRNFTSVPARPRPTDRTSDRTLTSESRGSNNGRPTSEVAVGERRLARRGAARRSPLVGVSVVVEERASGRMTARRSPLPPNSLIWSCRGETYAK